MEEDIRKQGMLYLQQQRFGKKWKRVWCVVFRESSCSISRLEFFEYKDGGNVEKNDKSLRKQQENKKVIRLADCIRVTEVEMDGCPRDTGPFLVETTNKIYVFAADRVQLDDWTHTLCEIAFPMSWMDGGVRRGSLQRGPGAGAKDHGAEDHGAEDHGAEDHGAEDHGAEDHEAKDHWAEDNTLYSGRDTGRDFWVCVRRTPASERCGLRAGAVLRVHAAALTLLNTNREAVYEWPYRYLRRFGRDKTTFSFEAGRRCDSGEGSFEFDTRQGNALFQAVETAISLQRGPRLPHPQTSGGAPGAPDSLQGLIQSRTRGHVPQSSAATQALYSVVTEPADLHLKQHREREGGGGPPQQQQRPPLARLELPLDKTLTGVRSLTLDTRGLAVPRKNQVKMISSCPLPQVGPAPEPGPAPAHQTYSQIMLSAERGSRRQKRSDGVAPPPLIPKEPEYSLPFDTLETGATQSAPPGAQGGDPLYDSIDEMKIRNVFTSRADGLLPTYGTVEHIYDEPEGCGAVQRTTGPPAAPPPVYDDPEEMRGDAWRIMGTAADPRGHEYPYNPRVDDYAVPKRTHRVCPAAPSTTEEEGEDGGVEPEEEEEELHDPPYDNLTVIMM